MNKFTCHGFRPVEAETLKDAALVFAARAARKAFGRRGYVRTCVQQAYAADMSFAEYSAFVGYSTGRNETTGHNINFTVARS